jgi:hypothetical protein
MQKKLTALWLCQSIFIGTLIQSVSARTWTDVRGRKVEAELNSEDGKTVDLVKPSGEEISIPFTRLSPEDQKYIQLDRQKLNADRAITMSEFENAYRRLRNLDVKERLGPPDNATENDWVYHNVRIRCPQSGYDYGSVIIYFGRSGLVEGFDYINAYEQLNRPNNPNRLNLLTISEFKRIFLRQNASEVAKVLGFPDSATTRWRIDKGRTAAWGYGGMNIQDPVSEKIFRTVVFSLDPIPKPRMPSGSPPHVPNTWPARAGGRAAHQKKIQALRDYEEKVERYKEASAAWVPELYIKDIYLE